MPKTRQEKIADWDKEIAQIKNKQKSEKQKLAKEERAARHCARGSYSGVIRWHGSVRIFVRLTVY